jgi:Ca-activated chloride channel homolog
MCAVLMSLVGLAVVGSATERGGASAPRGAVNLQARLSHGYLEAGKGQEVYGAIDMRALEVRGERRVPMNVAVVLDRSGSMHGERFEQAKEATRTLIEMLGESDRLALVTYGSDVTVEFASMVATGANKRRMLEVVERLSISGMTNLSGGLEAGIAQARAHAGGDTVNRVIMMSDGHANVGVTSVEQLSTIVRNGLEYGVTTSSLGFGLDYNAPLMTALAVEGAGNYYFADETTGLAGVFAKEISGLSNTVARNARVVIELSEGVELLELHGFTYRQQGRRVTVPLAEFYGRQSKDVFLKLHARHQAAGRRGIMDVRLIYFDVAADREVTVRANLEAMVTTDAALVEEHINGDVMARAQQIEIARSMKEAMSRYEAGQADEAAKILNEQRARTRAARQQYHLPQAESFERVEEEMAAMEDTVKSVPAQAAPARRMRKENSARSLEIMTATENF